MSDRGAAWALVGSGVATVLLEHAPYAHVVARPLVWISTLAHEGGHGLGVGDQSDGARLLRPPAAHPGAGHACRPPEVVNGGTTLRASGAFATLGVSPRHPRTPEVA